MAFIGNTNTTQAFTPAIDFFSGNGSTTAFTLSRPVASVAQVQVTIDNVAQNPSSAFTVSSNTITFTSAPLSGTNNVYVYYTSPITQVIAPGQSTVGLTAFTATGTPSASTFLRGDNSWASIASSQWTTTGSDIYYNTGNVGIGTSSPSQILDIVGTTPIINIQGGATTNARGLQFKYGASITTGSLTNFGGTGETALSGGASGSSGYFLTFKTDGSERMRIDSSGNVLVGTTSQNLGGRLFNVKTSGDVAGSFYRATSATNAEVFETRSDVSSTNVQKFAIYGNGDVKNTTGSYASFSDQRIKENIVDATPKLDDLLKVRIVNYNLIEDSDKLKMIGVIAQELETVFPNLVDENLDGVKAVKYSIFIPMLIKSIQELKAINDTQAETINALTARIVALENR